MTQSRKPASDDLVAALTQSVFPGEVAVASRDPRASHGLVDPAEAALIAGAVPHRQSEFHAGRAAARVALAHLGALQGPVQMHPDRSPVWPDGIVGSISHCQSACVAALARAAEWASLGVDLEEDDPLADDLISTVCTSSERAWLDACRPARRGNLAKLIFCCKEAVYKAQYPLTKTLFGFDHLEVQVDENTATFNATFLAPAGQFNAGQVFQGRYAHAAGYIVTGVTIRRGYYAENV